MFRKQPAVLTIGLLFLGALFTPCQAALMFTFSYSVAPLDPATDPAISASGTITTAETLTNGGYRLLSISGNRTLSFGGTPGVPQSFNTLLAPGSVGNSNLLFLTTPHLDWNGWGFQDGSESVNLYFSDPDGYTENRFDVLYGNLTINRVEQTSSVPEPASTVLIGTGLVVMSAWLRRSRRTGKIANP